MKKLANYIVLICALFTSNAVFAGSGACCLNGDVCYDTMNELTCQIWGGVWYPGFDCDSVTCETNCGGNCSPGESEDCFGNCFPAHWVGDGYCDDGAYQWDTNNIYLNCEEFGYDGGDCESPPDLPVSPGACCLGGVGSCDRVCENLTYADCVASGGQFLGENTICTDATCSCPPGMIADCNGNCFPLYYLNDGLCHDGHSYPENGDDAGAYELSLGCFELACDLGDCTGICGGACCFAVECVEDITPLVCAENGGTFLGGGESCSGVDCSSFLVPVHLTKELEGIGAYVEGHNGNRVDVKDNVIVIALANCLTVDGQPVSVVNIYVEQVFKHTFFVGSNGEMPLVATDGQRVVFSVNETVYVCSADENGNWDLESLFSAQGGDVWSSLSIDGDRILTHHGSTIDLYERSGSTWSFSHTFNAPYHYRGGFVDGDTVALLDVYLLEIWEKVGSNWVQTYTGWHNGEDQDIDIDGDRVIIGETTAYYPGTPSVGQARILKRTGSTWSQEAVLVPVDNLPDDDYGAAVSISGSVACVSATKNDGAATDGGVVAIFRLINGVWQHAGRVFASDAVEHMHFGADVAIDNDNIVVGWSRQDNWIQTFQGAQASLLSGYDWFNSDGGDIDDGSNWVPGLPSVKDTAQIGIPSSFTIAVDGFLPFRNLNVGTSRPILNLQNQNVTLGSNGDGSLDIAGSRSFTGNLAIGNGTLTVEGDVSVGNSIRPGGLQISDSGSIVVQGDYAQSRSGLLQIALGDPDVPSLEIHGSTSLNGSLEILLSATGVEPEVGDSWTVFKTMQMPEEGADRFRVMMMPGIGNAKYFDLEYVEADGGIELIVTVQSIDNLFNLEDEDAVNVNGRASDLVVADFGSLTGPADGFDDIALTIGGSPGFVYLFVNDGTGLIGSQLSYDAGNGPSSLDAGDLDGDGTIDIIATNLADNTFFAIINDGGSPSNMSVSEAFATGDVPVDVAIMNIDDSFDNEVVVACSGDGALLSGGEIAGELLFYQVTPNLRVGFSLAGSVALEEPSKIDPGDVNDDKDLPFISVTLAGANKVARLRKVTPLGPRGFDWEVVQEVSVGSNPQDLVMGDLDDDGDSDAVVANTGTNTLSVLVTNEFGDFNDELVIEVGDGPRSIELLDYDGDGDLDLAVIANTENDQRAIFIYRNDTSLNATNQITFALEQIFDEGLGPILVGSGELDGDSVEDLVSIVESTGLRGGDLTSIVDIRSIPGVVTCTGDLDTDGTVGVEDLLIVIAGWGSPDADLNGDGTTDVEDILIVISAWGDCS